MKYFKTNNEIRAIEKGQEFLIQNDWIEITEDEAILIANPPKTPEEIEVERIQSIKQRAGEIIKSEYSIEWQLNHPRLDETYISQYAWIDNIRNISNEAEANGTALEDIDWGI